MELMVVCHKQTSETSCFFHLQNSEKKPRTMAYSSNPSYLVEVRRITVQGQKEQKFGKTPSQQISLVQCYISVIADM
jgi:hypothetical protein